MKIKRYTADSMRAALALVRAEQGPDAVILSSRRYEEGIEVIAAVDYDDALFADVRPKAPPAAQEPPRAAATVIDPADRINAAMVEAAVNAFVPAQAQAQLQARAQMQAPATWRPVPPTQVQVRADTAHGDMQQQELQDMRHLMDTGLAAITWNDKRVREPMQARVLEELSSMNIEPDVALALAALTPERTTRVDPRQIPLALLCKYLPVITDETCSRGGIVAIVGPTGAGKTTTIAKLAARWCAQYGVDDIALISTDCYRSGAREQLSIYARNLGVPMYAADSGEELAGDLAQLSTKKLILIDTAGMGPRDVRLTEQLAALSFGAAQARVLLALPAQAEVQALEEIVRAYAPAAAVGCILTKVDEAASLGAVLSVTLRHEMKIAYVCDGQRVPEDLHAAAQKRMWLVRTAIQMKERAPRARNDAYLARNFGRASAHA